MNSFTTWKGISLADLALALFIMFLGFADAGTAPAVSLTKYAIWGVVVCVQVLGTLLRRTHALPAGIAVYLAALVRFILFPYQVFLHDVAVLLALYAVVVYAPRSARYPAIGGAMLGAGLLTIMDPRISGSIFSFLFIMATMQAVVIATAAMAIARWQQLSHVQSLIHQAESAQRDAEREAELAVINERTQIAREMHDIVAHTLSIVIAQADGGRYVAAMNPEAAQRSLEVIADMSRAALADIRSIIGVLRDPDDLSAPLAPQPIDADVKDMTDRIRESGRSISYVQTGQSRSLPVGAGNALFRICQEALTNALKHAGPQAHITVALHWRTNEVILTVSDNGRGAAAYNDGKGHGIIGMNERAAIFDGTVTAGPQAGGGFRVTATIPTSEKRTKHV
ncbi:sensor histidine kinase [Trueperella sp. LYQ143]|uniref:sensor histidine kinase n=1 Tax=unclassified Trueperella TaxID=2630174 RepID=UPI003983C1A4